MFCSTRVIVNLFVIKSFVTRVFVCLYVLPRLIRTWSRTYSSAAWRSGSERRFYDDHDRKVNGSPPNLVSLLRPWIRCFTMIISATLLGGVWQAANERSHKKIQAENLETKATPKRVWIRPTHSASVAFS